MCGLNVLKLNNHTLCCCCRVRFACNFKCRHKKGNNCLEGMVYMVGKETCWSVSHKHVLYNDIRLALHFNQSLKRLMMGQLVFLVAAMRILEITRERLLIIRSIYIYIYIYARLFLQPG